MLEGLWMLQGFPFWGRDIWQHIQQCAEWCIFQYEFLNELRIQVRLPGYEFLKSEISNEMNC